jgi:hypothetical protein
VNDAGTPSLSVFCNGRWTTTQARIRCHHTSRRSPIAVTLSGRVSTTRQQQTHTIEPQLPRLREYVTTQPEWHLAEEHLDRDDGYRGAKLKRPGLDRLRDRAALAAFARVLLTAPIGWPATMCIQCSSSRHSPSGAGRSRASTGLCVRTHTISSCSRSGGRWPRMNAP